MDIRTGQKIEVTNDWHTISGTVIKGGHYDERVLIQEDEDYGDAACGVWVRLDLATSIILDGVEILDD